jgi:hypothetical protein
MKKKQKSFICRRLAATLVDSVPSPAPVGEATELDMTLPVSGK